MLAQQRHDDRAGGDQDQYADRDSPNDMVGEPAADGEAQEHADDESGNAKNAHRDGGEDVGAEEQPEEERLRDQARRERAKEELSNKR